MKLVIFLVFQPSGLGVLTSSGSLKYRANYVMALVFETRKPM